MESVQARMLQNPEQHWEESLQRIPLRLHAARSCPRSAIFWVESVLDAESVSQILDQG
jgi:hypothetical protein